jgi:hypothetical protein
MIIKYNELIEKHKKILLEYNNSFKKDYSNYRNEADKVKYIFLVKRALEEELRAVREIERLEQNKLLEIEHKKQLEMIY